MERRNLQTGRNCMIYTLICVIHIDLDIINSAQYHTTKPISDKTQTHTTLFLWITHAETT